MAKFLSQDQINGAAGKKQDSSASGVTAVGGGGSCIGKEGLQAKLRQALPMLCACFRAVPEYKECFSLYDKQQRGKIKATDLLVSMRCLGASPTPGEVQRHLQTHGIDKHGELDFSTFLTIMHTQIKQEDPKKEILLAMLMADKEKKGYIMASELRSKLMKLGEKLTHKEDEAVTDIPGVLQELEFYGAAFSDFICTQEGPEPLKMVPGSEVMVTEHVSLGILLAVDDLFKEAGIEPNGQVKYDTFIQRITLPVQDY